MIDGLEPRCRQCGATDLDKLGAIPSASLFAGQRLEPAWDGGCLYECRRCHLGIRHPVRSQAEYEQLYESAPETVWVSQALREDQLRVVRLIGSRTKTSSVLDIGCYDGAMLQALGPAVRKCGVEASAKAAAVARSRGVEIVGSKISQLGSVQGGFDVVCAVDVIEHVLDPGAFVEATIGLLAPGGMLIISSGTIDSPQWRLVGGRYWYCGFPEHISFISPAWAAALAGRLDLDLQEVQRFAYSELPIKQLAKARRRWRLNLARWRIERLFAAWLGRHSGQPGRSIGQPGVFADHVVLAFSRRAEARP